MALFLIFPICTQMMMTTQAQLKPTEHLSGKTTDADMTTVIYYANETNIDAYTKLADWLNQNSSPEVQAEGEKLKESMDKLPLVVKKEVDDLIQGAVQRTDVALVVFTNTLACEGKFLYLAANATEPKEMPWKPFQSKLVVFQHHPLAHPANLRAALRTVAGTVDPLKTKFTLTTKSHGSNELAIAQAHAPLFEAKSAEELHRILKDIKDCELRAMETGKPIKSQYELNFKRILKQETESSQ